MTWPLGLCRWLRRTTATLGLRGLRPRVRGKAGARVFDVTPAHGVADRQPVQPSGVCTTDEDPIDV